MMKFTPLVLPFSLSFFFCSYLPHLKEKQNSRLSFLPVWSHSCYSPSLHCLGKDNPMDTFYSINNVLVLILGVQYSLLYDCAV